MAKVFKTLGLRLAAVAATAATVLLLGSAVAYAGTTSAMPGRVDARLAGTASAKGGPSVAAASSCPSAQLVGIRGSGEKKNDYGGFGYTVSSAIKSVQSAYSGTQAYAVNYQAIPVGYSDLYYGYSYRQSERSGVLAAETFLEIFHARCPGTPVELIGFSQGAQAAGDVFQEESKAIRSQIVALVLFGDPRFNPAQPGVDFGSYDPSEHGIWSADPSLGGTLRRFSPSQVKYVHSYCLRFDPICNWSLSNAVNCAPGLYCTHMHYPDFGYTDLAAKWLISRLPVKREPLGILNGSLPGATVNSAYAARLYGIGGMPPYTWKASGSLLSDGVSFNPAAATLAGKPAQGGQFSLKVTLGDAAGDNISQKFAVYVAPPASGSADWAMGGYDAGWSYDNTGESVLGPGNVGQLGQMWDEPKPNIGGNGDSLEYGGVVYKVDWAKTSPNGYNDVLFARSLADGSVIWSRSLGQYAAGSQLVAITNDIIIVSEQSVDHTFALAGLSLSNGRQLWSRPWSEYSTAVVDGNDIVVTGSVASGSSFGMLNATSGTVVWSLRKDHRAGALAVSDGIIVAVADVKNTAGQLVDYLEGLNEADGHVVWSNPPLTSPASFTHVEVSGTTLIDANPVTNELEGRDLTTGALLWQTPSYSNGFSGVATDGQTVYAATVHEGNSANTTTIHAFQDGQQVWHTNITGNFLPLYNPVLANGVIYAFEVNDTANTEVIDAFAAASGQPLWKSPPVPEVPDQQPYVARGCIVVGPVVFTVT